MNRWLIALIAAFFHPYSLSQDVTAETASKYAIYAMVASNSYHKNDRVHFPVEQLGWIQVDLNGKPTSEPTRKFKSGLAYDIFEKNASDEVIFAYRGTDSKHDYFTSSLTIPPFNIQYIQARKQFLEYKEKNPTKKITVTGHSLGGGLALSMSVRFGVDAVVFDSSPRVFDGVHNKHLPASRVAVYEDGEILVKARKYWHKFSEVVADNDVYKANFDFGKINKHRCDYLALNLLNLGATTSVELETVRSKIAK